MKFLILNGPNLNLLGSREPDVYGCETIEDYLAGLRQRYPQHTLTAKQSNVEGELINYLQQAAAEGCDGVVLNAGGYTHTSVALRDCIAAIQPLRVVEVHISNIYAREDFRRTSLISAVCCGTIGGFGLDVYRLAIEALA